MTLVQELTVVVALGAAAALYVIVDTARDLMAQRKADVDDPAAKFAARTAMVYAGLMLVAFGCLVAVMGGALFPGPRSGFLVKWGLVTLFHLLAVMAVFTAIARRKTLLLIAAARARVQPREPDEG